MHTTCKFYQNIFSTIYFVQAKWSNKPRNYQTNQAGRGQQTEQLINSWTVIMIIHTYNKILIYSHEADHPCLKEEGGSDKKKHI
jgi:hypothetical protein